MEFLKSWLQWITPHNFCSPRRNSRIFFSSCITDFVFLWSLCSPHLILRIKDAPRKGPNRAIFESSPKKSLWKCCGNVLPGRMAFAFLCAHLIVLEWSCNQDSQAFLFPSHFQVCRNTSSASTITAKPVFHQHRSLYTKPLWKIPDMISLPQSDPWKTSLWPD